MYSIILYVKMKDRDFEIPEQHQNR